MSEQREVAGRDPEREAQVIALRPEAWLAAQNEAFRAAVNGAPLEQSLGILVRMAVEQFDAGTRCAFYIADTDGRQLTHVIGMSEAYARQVDGFKIGVDSLACGLAVHSAEPVITADVREDTRWAPWLQLAEDHGYRACWSFPIETAAGKVVGTLAFYFREPRAAAPSEMRFAATLTHAAAIIIAQYLTQARLRDAEARQTFLLKLSDAQATAPNSTGLAELTCRLLGEHLQADRVVYQETTDTVDFRARSVCAQYVRGDAHGGPNSFRKESDGWESANPQLLAEAPLVVPDTATDPRLSEPARAAWLEREAQAFVLVRLARKGGEVGFRVQQASPRNWSSAEAKLISEVATRTWDAVERARIEAVLRESEERLRSAVEVGGLGLWDWDLRSDAVVWSDEHFRQQGYPLDEVAPSYEAWIARVHPDDREATEAALRQAMACGEAFAHDFRVVHPDGSVHWLSGRGRCFYDDAGRPQRMVGAMVDITERREWSERQKMLVAELQHRVRNILTVVRSVFTRTMETGGAMDEVADHFRGRLDALGRTQTVVAQSATGRVDLENLIRDELLSVGAADGLYVKIGGPEVALTPVIAEALGLAIHELTTNAIKYGALKVNDATLQISWKTNLGCEGTPALVLTWDEQGVPAVPIQPARQGFGTELIREALPYRLGADTELQFRGGGIRCTISVPLLDGPDDARLGRI